MSTMVLPSPRIKTGQNMLVPYKLYFTNLHPISCHPHLDLGKDVLIERRLKHFGTHRMTKRDREMKQEGIECIRDKSITFGLNTIACRVLQLSNNVYLVQ